MIIDLIYFINIVLSFIVGFYLFFQLQPLHHKLHTNALALYFVLNAFCFSFYLLIKYEYILYVPYFYKIPAPITYLIGPFAYFHLRFIISKKIQIKSYDWLHFIPFVLFLISYLKFYFMDLAEKEAYVRLLISDFSLTYTDHVGIIPEYVNSIGRLVHPLLYVVLQWILIYSTDAKALKEKDKKLYKWGFNFTLLQTIFALSLLVTVFTLPGITEEVQNSFLSKLPAILTISFFFTISIYLLWKQDILRKLKYFKVEYPEDDNEKTNKLAELTKLVEEKAYFTDVDLSISKLSALLQVSQQELSNLINSEYSSYNEWINQIRINYCISLLTNDFLKTYDVEYLATKSGFNSKNTFYRSFKRITNTTPTKFVQSIQTENELL
ncbi:helix-turn-helix domain-containing protein [Psychroflexus maritimus]|uniref:Helix-turn-helix transcriptional regulator n=1 Tax=Psychroflexus maritimus TaxID=2714865 RepID=A0A967ADB1_9FLAO|nr:AraC family transcriptional regulator [Psychroflexus maritimus]NGZ90174.1 helix-turn-helix transcriptional regulator [Psychroflexus maritimus]